MKRNRLQTAILGELRHAHCDELFVIPTGAIFQRERNRDGGTHRAQQLLHQGQVAQQARSAVALDDLIHRTAEVNIQNVEAKILADARGIGHDGGVGAEKLGGNGMLLGLEGQVLQGAGRLA